MAKKRLQPSELRDPIRYSLGWQIGNTVYLAGAVSRDNEGNVVGLNDIKTQTRRIFEKLDKVLHEAGGSIKDIVRITAFITDLRFQAGYDEVRRELYPTNPPASSILQVVALAAPGALLEIEATAVIGE